MRLLVCLVLLMTPAPVLAADASAAAKAAAMPDKLICKKERETGSLVKRRKTCMTAAQWRDLYSKDRIEVDRQEADRRSSCIGCWTLPGQ